MSDPFRVDGKVALITGGATGIGAATAWSLAEGGATAVITDINDAQGAKTVAALKDAGHKAAFYHLDTTSEEDWESVVDKVVADHGGLDVLVNNAGVLFGAPVTETTLKDFRWLHQVNVEGVFLGMKYAARVMRPEGAAGKGGSIINLSSVAGLSGATNLIAYGSSKGSVRLMTKFAAVEFAGLEYGIRVNSVHPCPVDTSMGDDLVEAFGSKGPLGDDEAARNMLVQGARMKRFAKPEEIANAIRYLASDAASFTNGSELVVDGAATA